MTDDDFNAITDWTFALLTMRVNTPGGEWLAEDFERVYVEGWRELEQTFGADTANEHAILDATNLGMHLVDYLVTVTGQPASYWLERLRQDYVQHGRGDDES